MLSQCNLQAAKDFYILGFHIEKESDSTLTNIDRGSISWREDERDAF